MLPLFGQPVLRDGDEIILQAAGALSAPAEVVHIPADPSSAAFFAVMASLVPGSSLMLPVVGINPRRDGWRRILQAMGADIEVRPGRDVGTEAVADLHVRAAQLHGVVVNPADVPDAIDEFPILFVAAALAEGEFILQGAEELRVKESDRISCMVTALKAAGADIEERPDGVRICGKSRLSGGVSINARGDHRIAMAMAVAGQCADQPVTILNAAAIATSFPDFVPLARAVGMGISDMVCA